MFILELLVRVSALRLRRLYADARSIAYFNGTGDYKALNFYLGENNPNHVEPGVYGIGVTQIRDGTPLAGSAYAIFGFQQFEWKSDADGVILHKETEALNRFYGMFHHSWLFEQVLTSL